VTANKVLRTAGRQSHEEGIATSDGIADPNAANALAFGWFGARYARDGRRPYANSMKRAQQPRSASPGARDLRPGPSKSRVPVAESVLKIVIVDPEPLSRSILVRLCQSISTLELVAQVDSGAEGLQVLRTQQPDVMLIDVDLKDMDGFELLRSVCSEQSTLPIVISARASRAVAAFNADVVDFLSKPVALQRFEEALRRVQRRREALQPLQESFSQTAWPANALAALSGRAQLIAGERERRLYLIDPKTIDYIEAYGNYVRIWSGAYSYISRERIAELAATLATLEFVRVERSKLINLRAVAYLEKNKPGTFTFTLSTGAQINSTPTYRDEILRAVHPGTLSVRHRVKQ
jgi:two-component system LytT family response regulator